MAQGFTKSQPLETDTTLSSNATYIAPSVSAAKGYVDNRITQAEADDLTDGGDSLLHYHASDRDSANFTGTFWLDLTDGGLTTLHTHSASSITTGTMATARLGSGSASASTILYGDQTYKGAPTAETLPNDIFRCNPGGVASTWTGTINGTPSGTSVVVSTTTGNTAVLVPASTSQYAKLRLRNTTRGDYALISNFVVGTNTATLTANAPAGWASGDVLTIASPTTSGYAEVEITSGITKEHIFLSIVLVSSTAGFAGNAHPLETFNLSKNFSVVCQVGGVSSRATEPFYAGPAFTIAWEANVTAYILRYRGFLR